MCNDKYKQKYGSDTLNIFATQAYDSIYVLKEAIEKAGYKPGVDFKIALDAASSEWVQPDGNYKMPK